MPQNLAWHFFNENIPFSGSYVQENLAFMGLFSSFFEEMYNLIWEIISIILMEPFCNNITFEETGILFQL